MGKSPRISVHKQISCVSHPKILLHVHIFPIWKRHPKISKTLAPDLLYMERSLHPRDLDLLLTTISVYTYIESPLLSSTQKIPNPLTIEFLEIFHSLTWHSESLWPALHWCSLLGFWFLVLQVPIGLFKGYQFTDNFCTLSITFTGSLTWLQKENETYSMWVKKKKKKTH